MSAAIFILLYHYLVPATAAGEPLHILHINAYHAGYKWSDDIDAVIRERLDGSGIDHILHVDKGLGLFIAYFIVTTGHSGQLDVASRPGVVTRFTLRLPLESGEAAPPPGP